MTRKRCNRRRTFVASNPVALALDNVRTFTPDEQRAHMRPALEALAGLRSARGSLRLWRDLADALNIAEALAELGIANNLRDQVAQAQAALRAVIERARSSRQWFCHAAEAVALDDALFVLRVQLQHCSAGEHRRAVERVRNLISQALAGNGGPGVTVHGGEGLDAPSPDPTLNTTPT